MGTKFEGVDVLDFLGQVVELHTQHYKEDFDMDKELIQNLARNMQPEKCNLLWMSRPCGTYCLSEREVYLQDSNENKVWMFYHEQANDPILAYALTLDGLQDGKVTGTIYPLDYPSHVERVKSLSCPIDRVTVTFEDGVQFTLPYQSRRRQINELMPEHGTPKSIQYAPESERELAVILRRERLKRDYHAKPGNVQEYMEKLKKASMRGRLKEARTAAAASPEAAFPEQGAGTMKGGRSKKSVRVEFVMSEQEAELVKEHMAEMGITNLSAYLRKMAVDGYIIHLDMSDIQEMIRLLRICSNNLNQYTRRANETGSVYAADVEDLRTRLDDLWNGMDKLLRGFANIS